MFASFMGLRFVYFMSLLDTFISLVAFFPFILIPFLGWSDKMLRRSGSRKGFGEKGRSYIFPHSYVEIQDYD